MYISDLPWRELAACRGLSGKKQLIFFGDSSDDNQKPLPTTEQHDEARAMCYGCPVQFDCLAYAVETDQKYGVWGGITESQRKRYLYPAIREHGRTDKVISDVIKQCGVRVRQRIEAQLATTTRLVH